MKNAFYFVVTIIPILFDKERTQNAFSTMGKVRSPSGRILTYELFDSSYTGKSENMR